MRKFTISHTEVNNFTPHELIDDVVAQVNDGKLYYPNRLDRWGGFGGVTFQHYHQHTLIQLINTCRDPNVRNLLRPDVLQYVRRLTTASCNDPFSNPCKDPWSVLICATQSNIEYNTIKQCTYFKRLHAPIAKHILTYIRQPLCVEPPPDLNDSPTLVVKHLSNAQYDDFLYHLNAVSVAKQHSPKAHASHSKLNANQHAGPQICVNVLSDLTQVSLLVDNSQLHIPFILYKLFDDFPSLDLLVSNVQLQERSCHHEVVNALLKTMQYANQKHERLEFNSQLLSTILALVGKQSEHFTIANIIATANLDLIKAFFRYCNVVVNRQDQPGKTPLQPYNNNFNIQDQYGKTALMHAILGKKYNIVEWLLKHGSDIRLQDNDGKTAFMHALVMCADWLDQEKLMYLTHVNSCTRHTNLQDNTGKTALMYAVLLNRSHVVEWLVDNHANLYLLDRHNMTAFMYAQSACAINGVMLGMLNHNTSDIYDTPAVAPACMVKCGLEDILAVPADGKNATMMAAQIGNLHVLEIVSQGIDVDLTDYSGKTALMYAVIHQHEAIVAYLLTRHANTTIVDFADKPVGYDRSQLHVDEITSWFFSFLQHCWVICHGLFFVDYFSRSA